MLLPPKTLIATAFLPACVFVCVQQNRHTTELTNGFSISYPILSCLVQVYRLAPTMVKCVSCSPKVCSAATSPTWQSQTPSSFSSDLNPLSCRDLDPNLNPALVISSSDVSVQRSSLSCRGKKDAPRDDAEKTSRRGTSIDP